MSTWLPVDHIMAIGYTVAIVAASVGAAVAFCILIFHATKPK